ncbi:MAG: hypothetical protein HFF01_09565 [Erysipelotrichaceae bacterium]|nr:hypothetical protein [Erysipelotrichaceae bacterium]
MRKYIALTKALLKNGMGMSDGKSKKFYQVFLYVVLLISLVPISGALYFLIDEALPTYSMIDQEASLLGGMMFMSCFLIFFFSLFSIPSIFYFSRDNDNLLSLPLSSTTIIGAKFTTCLIYEYVFSVGVLLPTYLAYMNHVDVSVLFYVFGILSIFLIPVFPLVLSTFLTILLMRIAPFLKNRDRFNLISGILMLIVAFSFSYFTNHANIQEESDMIHMVMQGDNSMLELFMRAFPMIPYFSRSIIEGNIMDFAIGCLICFLSLLLLLSAGKYLYFKGVIGSNESSSSAKDMSEKQLRKQSRQGNRIRTYMAKEFKILVRTPVFFINCILTTVLMPVIFLILPFLGTLDGETMSAVTKGITALQELDNFYAYVLFVGLGCGCMFGVINLVSATAISREGNQYMIMKVLPISFRDQVYAKLWMGILLGFFTNFCTLIILWFYLHFSLEYLFIFFIASCITTVFCNDLCMMLDLTKPKLVWEQEASAVKQNFGAFVSMFGGMALCAVIIIGCFFIPEDYLQIGAIALTLTLLVLCVVLTKVVGRYGEKAMRRL